MSTHDLDHLIDLAESADAELSQEVRSGPSLRAQERRFGGSPGPTLRRLLIPLTLPTSETEALQHFLLGSRWFRKPRAAHRRPELGSG